MMTAAQMTTSDPDYPPASERGWSLQASMRVGDVVVTVRHSDPDAFERLLGRAAASADLIAAASADVLDAFARVSPAPTGPLPPPAPWPPTGRPAPPTGRPAPPPWPSELAAAAPPPGAPTPPPCGHGPRRWIAGMNSRGPWAGWACAAGDDPGRCPTLWVDHATGQPR